ncbi:GNAT family N-acetyltransferase [Litoreibacter roseus]|uniref:N-acetyltransferase domain-containing protein n=1 Tax=Litoreibacter roseus TaxID=2601869 RepID=A0A6N6JI23_9RHOB|nr:GNAT family N-acetyltransferase [Litoreibacter roseus]GFE65754.1 hypothetical protein KIN_28280 [Litoreibacter roseus]
MGSGRISGSGARHVALRTFRPTDSSATYKVFFEAVRRGAATLYSEADLAAWAASEKVPERWGERLSLHHTLIAEREGRIIGFMSIAKNGYLDMAYVLPSFMGQGVAEKLYTALENWARAAKIDHLTTEASHLARSFFARQGWTTLTPQTVHRNGRDILNFRMEKHLS